MTAGARRAMDVLLWSLVVAYSAFELGLPVGDGDESGHVIIMREMLASGNLLEMRWQGALSLSRPQLPYWLALPFAALVPGEIGWRLSSVFASLATLIVVYATAARCFGRRDAAWLATLLLAGSPSFHVFSRTMMSDPPFVLALTVALSGAALMQVSPRGVPLAAAGLGLALACKSFAAAIPLLALAPWLVRGVALQRAHRRTLIASAALFAALALPFYAIGFALHGQRFWDEHVMFNLVRRAMSGYGLGLAGGPLGYLRWVPAAEGPAVALWLLLGTLGAVIAAIRFKLRDVLLFGSYAAGVIALLSLMATRLPHYILPAYPGAALAVAGLYAAATRDVPAARRTVLELVCPLLALLLLGWNMIYDGGRHMLLQRSAGKTLGHIVRQVAAPGETLYVYEWYGPSLGLYGERPVKLLTRDRASFETVNIDVMRSAGAVVFVPPAPAPVGSRILIAGPPDELARAPWLAVEQVLGHADMYLLARARVIGP